MKNPPTNAGDRAQALGWQDPLKKERAAPVFLPGKSCRQRTLAGYRHGVTRVGYNLVAKQEQQPCIFGCAQTKHGS